MFGLTRKEKILNSVRDGDLLLFDELVNSGVDVNSVGKDGFTPLLVACDTAQFNIIKHLVDAHKVDVHVVSKNNENAVLLCAARGSLEGVAYLHNQNVDLNIQTLDFKVTPLLTAIASGYDSIAIYLINNVADLSKTDKFGNDALMASARFGNVKVAQLLLEKKFQ